MSRSGSKGAGGGFVVIGNPGNRRVDLFQAALRERGHPPARLVSYADLLAGRVHLRDVVRLGDTIRIESPGKDWEIERALLLRALEFPDGDPRYEVIPEEVLRTLPFERGRILASRQLYRGFMSLMISLGTQLATYQPNYPDCVMLDPYEVQHMFDKLMCHARLEEGGVPVPPRLGEIDSYETLRTQMHARGWARVFVKLAHGSSASGAVAYATSGDRQRAYSTVEMVDAPDGLRLYNSRRLQVYDRPKEIARLIDALCRHDIHVERWIPKAGIDGRTFDVRVVVIGGEAQHTVVRMSRGPMTNLHLLNTRGDLQALIDRMGADAWAQARATCEQAMRCFPRSLYGGVDLLIEPGFRRHVVLEVNAFGDLLPGVLWHGMDTYTAQLDTLAHGYHPVNWS